MPTFRVEFEWSSALRGRATRADGYRSSRAVRFITKPSAFVKDDLPEISRLIAEEATRVGMKDVHIRIKHVTHQVINPKASDSNTAGRGETRVH